MFKENCPYIFQTKKCFVYFNKILKMVQYIINMEFYKEKSYDVEEKIVRCCVDGSFYF